MPHVTCVTRLIHPCDMTHSPVWHDLFRLGRPYHNLFPPVAWLMSHVRHDLCLMSYMSRYFDDYGVAICRRLLEITGLFCKRALSKRRYSAKETYNFKEPTNRSHPIHASPAINPVVYVTDLTHSHVRHDSFTCETWLTHMWDMTHSRVWCDACRLSRYYRDDSHVWHDSFTCVMCDIIHTCDMPHLDWAT